MRLLGGLGVGDLEPDLRGPARYLIWLLRCQPWRLLRAMVLSSLWMTGLAVPPYLVARAVDDGLRAGDTAALLGWTAAVVVMGVVSALLGAYRHRTMTLIRNDAAMRTHRVLVRHAVRTGAALPRTVNSGEVASVGGTDARTIAESLTFAGPGFGAIVAYVVVGVVLAGISPLIATVVLVGVPAILVGLGPLLRRLQGVQGSYRRRQGELTARAGDIVAGLRVLAGLGGQRGFHDRYVERSADLQDAGYRVAGTSSWVQAVGLGAPALFLGGVVWLSAHLAVRGEIRVGELVAVYGYVAQLIAPVAFLVDGAAGLARGLVSARRIVAVLSVRPDHVDDRPCAASPAVGGELHDPVSGVRVPAGLLTALVADDPADAVAVIDRLGRFSTTDAGATWGGVPVSAVPLAELRSRVLVADNLAHLFPGALRATFGDAEPAAVASALRTAVAEDVVDGLPGGLDGRLDAQGRNLSGGQRQRLRLARALAAEPDVLLLVEPTSAVDAITEAAIYERLRASRAGRTTVVAASTPLLLDQAEHVVHLVRGRVHTAGTRAELLRDRRYAELVRRADPPEESDLPAAPVEVAR
ncbi:ABC transporter transmembrane domain-containing protein [Pseudonocardia sp. CA-107938]|uniref:ABC transporter transmembrane domain-containing protein n=1 Tax=Pseudonocardia sp. CA-107938 TaxID=3240021 RepID=UPI003D8D11ED